MVGPVLQGLNPAGRCAGSDRDNDSRILTHLLNTLFVAGRRNGTFHQRDIVRTRPDVAARFKEIGDLHPACQFQQFVLARQQRKLTAVARRELVDSQSRPRLFLLADRFRHSPSTFIVEATRS